MSWILVKEVAAREIRTRSRTKAFRVITGILVAAAIIGPIVAAVWPEGGDDLRQVTVGLVNVDEATRQQILAFSEDSLDVKFQDLSDFSADQVDQALTDGDINVALDHRQRAHSQDLAQQQRPRPKMTEEDFDDSRGLLFNHAQHGQLAEHLR